MKMELKGDRIRIVPMEMEHVYLMRDWGTHENPLLFDYNMPPLRDDEIIEWYHYKTMGYNKKYYSVFNEHNRFIGYMGIKQIRWILREATLGIVFDPNFINQGYGTEGILTFLDYYFNHMNMKRMYLEVAKFNKRAIRCYKKSGFSIVDIYIDEFFDQNLDLENPYFLKEKSSFVLKDGKVYNYIYKMKIDKKTYLKEGEEVDGKTVGDQTRTITK
ncbi:GNAT family N-acetyltransferase [Clostridium sp. Cult3]|uniref:GNAT family N-acetyltransferase n=1 Tax=Clostridium sp. Cult3 TaxID=2079004 RepID=UPI001F41213D|nr:GNAT family protein [Clostridium sp. Cult3]